LNIAMIVSELKAERNRIDRAVAALEGLSPNGVPGKTQSVRGVRTRKRGHLSVAGRKRLSEMMKKRWAERRKKAAAKK
jgi:hypothetical protein